MWTNDPDGNLGGWFIAAALWWGIAAYSFQYQPPIRYPQSGGHRTARWLEVFGGNLKSLIIHFILIIQTTPNLQNNIYRLGNTVPIIFYVVGSIWNWSGNTPAQPVVSMQLHLSQVFRSQRYIHGKPCKTLRQTTVHSWWVLPTMYQAWWPMFLWRLFWVRLTLLLVLLWGYHQIYTRKIPA